MIDIEFINSEKLIDFIKELNNNIGIDNDIVKIQCRIPNEINNTLEAIAYRRIKSIAKTKIENINFAIAIQYLTEDVKLIAKLIKDKDLKCPEKLKEFTENAIAIMTQWDDQYRKAFNTIKEFRDSYKAPKSIDEMNADELRKYIKQHNIK